MFVTRNSYRINHPLTTADESYWNLVYKTLNTPWLYCMVEQLNETENISNILLVDDVDELIKILANKGIIVQEIYVVTPSHINKSSEWKMDRLLYLGKANLIEEASVVYKYILSKGEVIYENFIEIDPIKLVYETIYEI